MFQSGLLARQHSLATPQLIHPATSKRSGLPPWTQVVVLVVTGAHVGAGLGTLALVDGFSLGAGGLGVVR